MAESKVPSFPTKLLSEAVEALILPVLTADLDIESLWVAPVEAMVKLLKERSEPARALRQLAFTREWGRMCHRTFKDSYVAKYCAGITDQRAITDKYGRWKRKNLQRFREGVEAAMGQRAERRPKHKISYKAQTRAAAGFKGARAADTAGNDGADSDHDESEPPVSRKKARTAAGAKAQIAISPPASGDATSIAGVPVDPVQALFARCKHPHFSTTSVQAVAIEGLLASMSRSAGSDVASPLFAVVDGDTADAVSRDLVRECENARIAVCNHDSLPKDYNAIAGSPWLDDLKHWLQVIRDARKPFLLTLPLDVAFLASTFHPLERFHKFAITTEGVAPVQFTRAGARMPCSNVAYLMGYPQTNAAWSTTVLALSQAAPHTVTAVPDSDGQIARHSAHAAVLTVETDVPVTGSVTIGVEVAAPAAAVGTVNAHQRVSSAPSASSSTLLQSWGTCYNVPLV